MNREQLSENAMFEYIKETPEVLEQILSNRKEITKPFISLFTEQEFERIIIIGSGTSYHGAASTKGFLERTLQIPVEAYYPILYTNQISVFNQKTLVIGISQGGESKSTIKGLEYSKEHGCYTVSITEAGKDSKLAAYSDMALKLHSGDKELAGPKTKGYQATMLNLVLLALETALALEKITAAEYDVVIQRIQKSIGNLDLVIENSVEWYQRNRDEFRKANRIIVIGYDNNYGNVLEGRLKIEEAVRFGIEGYELEEFMHGIYHSIDESVFMVSLASESVFKERAIKLCNFMSDYSKHQFIIGADLEESERNLSMSFVDDPDFSFFEYIIPLQILAFLLSKDLGINANIPKIKNFHYLVGSK